MYARPSQTLMRDCGRFFGWPARFDVNLWRHRLLGRLARAAPVHRTEVGDNRIRLYSLDTALNPWDRDLILTILPRVVRTVQEDFKTRARFLLSVAVICVPEQHWAQAVPLLNTWRDMRHYVNALGIMMPLQNAVMIRRNDAEYQFRRVVAHELAHSAMWFLARGNLSRFWASELYAMLVERRVIGAQAVPPRYATPHARTPTEMMSRLTLLLNATRKQAKDPALPTLYAELHLLAEYLFSRFDELQVAWQFVLATLRRWLTRPRMSLDEFASAFGVTAERMALDLIEFRDRDE